MFDYPLLWLIAGASLCLMELVFPTAFVALMMGIGALLTAAFALVVPLPSLQIIVWLIASSLLTVASRRLVPRSKPRHANLEDSREGETIGEILPGQAGRVLYEGNSWRAKCADERLAIAPQQKVYIVQRQGNTLIVLPARLLDSHE